MIAPVARLLLAAAFATAAAGKLLRRAETEATITAFGVPAALRRPVAIVLPLVELAVAAALLVPAAAAPAGVAALSLLGAFSLAVARVLARGAQVDCNCFGALGPSRISRWTLVRNLALMVPAGFVAVAGASNPGPSVVAWAGGLDANAVVVVVAGVALVGTALSLACCWQLMRQNGRLLARLDRLDDAGGGTKTVAARLGEPAPAFAYPDLDGRSVTLGELLDGRRLLLVFTDPGCQACDPLLGDLGRRQRDPESDLRPVLISRGDPEANRAKAAEHGLELVLLQEDFELARSVGVAGMPGALVLDREGRIAGEPAVGTGQVADLLVANSPSLRLTRVGASR
jgi:peroxiredoxin